MKKFSGFLLVILALALVISGCTQEEQADLPEPVEGVEFTDDSYIVDIDWLNSNLDNENLLIIDARGEEAHGKGHIPGAVAVSWQQFTLMEGGPGDPDWGTVLEAEALSERFSEIGVAEDKEIVIYSETIGAWGEDGRILWMLRSAGLDNSKLLDGGFNLWEAEGYEISTDEVTPIPSDFVVAEADNSTIIDTDELAESLDDYVIIDARATDEYEGAQDFGESRGGHLPGAINIPFTHFLSDDGTIKEAGEIQAILDENGIEKTDDIITYCTAGIRSAHMQIVMTMMGYDNVRNYDASFYEWSANPDLPLENE